MANLIYAILYCSQSPDSSILKASASASILFLQQSWSKLSMPALQALP